MKEERFFYCPDARNGNCLSKKEAGHALRVWRRKTGEYMTGSDGKGSFFEARIIETTKQQCYYEIVRETKQQRPWKGHLHLAIAPTKHMDRMEWLVEKVTEIGIDEITFLNCQYSERHDIKIERIEKTVISAMKQSHKACKPHINDMCRFTQFVKQQFQGLKFIAHCYSDQELCPEGKPFLMDALNNYQEDILILIGPEGDFSRDEVELALANKFQPVSLGECRLRTETAGLVALHIMNLNNRTYRDATLN